jgi:hypothetical protein
MAASGGHARYPSSWEAEAGGWRVLGQPGVQSETMPLKQTNKQTKTTQNQGVDLKVVGYSLRV